MNRLPLSELANSPTFAAIAQFDKSSSTMTGAPFAFIRPTANDFTTPNVGSWDTWGPTQPITPSQRQRPPPRSRTGCWTCRSRKVKCDEAKPYCNKCTSRNIACDYSPRLEWHPITLEKLDRYREISRTGCPVWDENVPFSPIIRSPDKLDFLRSFQSLATDEERERLAYFQRPGTYFVVVPVSSFAHLPEYRRWQPNRGNDSSRSRESWSYDDASFFWIQNNSASETHADSDPNIVFISRFEDPSAQITFPLESNRGADRNQARRSHSFHYANAPPLGPNPSSGHSRSSSGNLLPFQQEFGRMPSNSSRESRLPTLHQLPHMWSLPVRGASATSSRMPQVTGGGRTTTAPAEMTTATSSSTSGTSPQPETSVPSAISSRSGSLLEEMLGLGHSTGNKRYG